MLRVGDGSDVICHSGNGGLPTNRADDDKTNYVVSADVNVRSPVISAEGDNTTVPENMGE